MSGWARKTSGAALALLLLSGSACAKRKALNLEMTREVVVGKPAITEIVFEPAGLIDTSEAGRAIDVLMAGDENLEATFDLEGTGRRLMAQPMKEVEPGRYAGRFEVKQHEKGRIWVSGHLVHRPTGARQDRRNEEPLELVAKERAEASPAGTCDAAAVARFDQALQALTTRFEFNKFNLTAEARGILDGAGSILSGEPLCLIEVHGHADDVGSPQYNMDLSKNRATAVAGYLESRGIPMARMTVIYHGEEEPLESGASPEARARNRRVELHAAASR